MRWVEPPQDGIELLTSFRWEHRIWLCILEVAALRSVFPTDFYGFRQSLQANAAIVGHDRFLPDSFRFIIQGLSCRSLLHKPRLLTATLHGPGLDSGSKMQLSVVETDRRAG